MAKKIVDERPNAQMKTSDPDFRALLTKMQMEAIEKKSCDFGVNRRMTLLALTRSRAQLIEGGGGSPEQVGQALLDMVEAVSDFQAHLKELEEISTAAFARLMVAAQTMVDQGLVE